MANRHGLEDEAASILEASGKSPEEAQALLGSLNSGSLLVPQQPLFRQTDVNWPLLAISRGLFDANLLQQPAMSQAAGADVLAAPVAMDDVEVGGDWGMDDIPELSDKPAVGGVAMDIAAGDGEGGWDIDDDDLKLDLAGVDVSAAVVKDQSFVVPSPGIAATEWWSRNSGMAVDQIAAGSFANAMQLFNRQAGIIEFEPLKPYFMNIYMSTRSSVAGVSGVNSLLSALHRNWQEAQPRTVLPMLPTTFASLVGILQEAYQATTAGKFTEALELFTRVLHSSLFVVASKRSEIDEVSRDDLVSVSDF
jgi:coatomer protein complex subunit alpha (xenin)